MLNREIELKSVFQAGRKRHLYLQKDDRAFVMLIYVLSYKSLDIEKSETA